MGGRGEDFNHQVRTAKVMGPRREPSGLRVGDLSSGTAPPGQEHPSVLSGRREMPPRRDHTLRNPAHC
jgi:hypothetical protein